MAEQSKHISLREKNLWSDLTESYTQKLILQRKRKMQTDHVNTSFSRKKKSYQCA